MKQYSFISEARLTLQDLNDPKYAKLIKQVKSRIHKNPYLRDKFYGVHTLYHMTPSSNLKSIYKNGIVPKNGKLISRATNNQTDSIPRLVYTMDNPEKLKRYFKYIDIQPDGSYTPIKRNILKLRVPQDVLKSHRVADPLEQVSASKSFRYNPLNHITKSALKHYPNVDKLINPDMAGRGELNSVYDIIDTLYKKQVIPHKMSPKQFRKWFSNSASKEDKYNVARLINQRFPRGNYTPDTVALNTDIKPEWIANSPNKIKYTFQNQIDKDPERSLSIINDLIKRK